MKDVATAPGVIVMSFESNLRDAAVKPMGIEEIPATIGRFSWAAWVYARERGWIYHGQNDQPVWDVDRIIRDGAPPLSL